MTHPIPETPAPTQAAMRAAKAIMEHLYCVLDISPGEVMPETIAAIIDREFAGIVSAVDGLLAPGAMADRLTASLTVHRLRAALATVKGGA